MIFNISCGCHAIWKLSTSTLSSCLLVLPQVTWGQSLGEVPKGLQKNVREIFGTPYSFAALVRLPGEYDSIVTWGDRKSGGHIDYPKKFLADNLDIRAIHSHFEGSRNGVFIAEVGDGDGLYAWGDPRYGAVVSAEIKQRRLQTTSTTCFTDAIPIAARNSAGPRLLGQVIVKERSKKREDRFITPIAYHCMRLEYECMNMYDRFP